MTGRSWARWIGVNLVFAAFHPWLGLAWPAPATSLAISGVLFVLPAVGWSSLVGAGTRALGMRLLRDLAISTCVFFCTLGALRVAGVTPTQVLGWNLMWALTNLGLAVSAVVGTRVPVRRSLTRQETILGGALFLACYLLYYYGATRVVPPQVDQDLEVQATGFGLLARFEPLLLTDRGSVYFFAHPPLLHFYVGGSFLLYGALPDLELFDAASRRALAAREAAIATGSSSAYEAVDKIELKAIYDRYADRPHFIETRTPNLFFASATVALLGIWAGRISRRWWLGLLAAVAYASNPEVFVRSSYGGYFAIGALAAALMLLAAERWRRCSTKRKAVLSLAAGWFAGFSDHKLVLLPAALQLSALAGRWMPEVAVSRDEPARRVWRSAWSLHPVSIGFGLGLVTFWCFGLAWAPAILWRDHFHDHLLDRITHENPLKYAGYPTPVGLWREFASHTAFALVPLAWLLLFVDTVWPPSLKKGGPGPLRGLWLVWTLLTAAAFTVVDWRMTKHLVPMLLPLHLGLMPSPKMPEWRTALSVVALAFVVMWNAWTLQSLMGDFAGFRVGPGW